MCIYSKFRLQWEKRNLSPYAVHSDHPWYTRRSPKDKDREALDRHGSRSRYRTCFELDKDRITNSQAFRRLEYKTQVFVTHEGDNFRTRLTHSLEVSEIARHIASALRLNENLVESIALGHDLGHAPYGHVAEKTINEWIAGLNPPLEGNYFFCHNRHSVENVEHLEPGYDWDNRDPLDPQKGFSQGLNLTLAAREGILTHTTMGFRGQVHMNACFDDKYEKAIRQLSEANRKKGLFYPGSLEAQVVRIADDLAQRIHDLEDGFRSSMLKKEHIREYLWKFFTDLQDEILDPSRIAEGRYLVYKKYGTSVSKALIADIVEMLDLKGNQEDGLGKQDYTGIPDMRIEEINEALRTDPVYREKFLMVAEVSFLLHMWRKDDYLDHLTEEDQINMRTRILKYVTLLRSILGLDGDPGQFPPTYHIVAFLRGLLLANVIEHSFWNIQRLLDPEFGSLSEQDILDQLVEPQECELAHQWHVVFIVVDGITREGTGNRHKLVFEPARESTRRICFSFDSEEEKLEFMDNHFEEILAGNGAALSSGKFAPYNPRIIRKIRWLNKAEDTSATEYARLETGDGGPEAWIPVDQINVFFTGYKELCPGSPNGDCDLAPKGKCANADDCPFRSSAVKYPDISRLVEFQEEAASLDRVLKKVIAQRIHRGSRIARMNFMGEKIIRELLCMYLSRPRIMHDRVWSRLRIYPEMQDVSKPVSDWVHRPIIEKEKMNLPQHVLDRLLDEKDPKFECNRYSLIRNIINHIAGMTDRFIANEFNRINQSGREVERQDETYFFS